MLLCPNIPHSFDFNLRICCNVQFDRRKVSNFPHSAKIYTGSGFRNIPSVWGMIRCKIGILLPWEILPFSGNYANRTLVNCIANKIIFKKKKKKEYFQYEYEA